MRAVGLILAGGNSRKMRELTAKRAVAAMPVAGSYRAIDFVLSNMTNSHIQKVAVLTQYNARSLNGRDMEKDQFTFTVTPKATEGSTTAEEAAEKFGLANAANTYKNEAAEAGAVL